MIEEMARCHAQRASNVRITKWRLTYSQANDLAHELYAMRGPGISTQSVADLVGMMMDGNMKMFGIPVEVKFRPGQAYPIAPRFIRYSQPSWLKAWMS